MIKLLTISGSPVDNASTDILLKKSSQSFIDTVEDDVDYRFVKLNDLEFIACQSCGFAPDEGFCVYEDDLQGVYAWLAECDCLLFGSPVYFDSVSAQSKMFIDRCNCLRPYDFKNEDPDHSFIKLIKKKRPGGMILVGGERGWFEGARRVMAGFFKWIEVVNEGQLYFHTKDIEKGEAGRSAEAMDQAHWFGVEMAEKLKKYAR